MSGKKLGDHERPRLGNDIFQHPHLPKVHPVDPADGMPRPASTFSMEDALAPALTIETMVCMEDASQYVVLDFWGKPLLTFDAARVKIARGALALVEPTGEELVIVRNCAKHAETSIDSETWVQVQPLREQCSHYRRVMLDFEGGDQAKHVERSCAAQRTEGGEYVSLADTRVYACEHRYPRDFVSEERLRKFDGARLAEAKKSDEEYDVGAALAAMKENSENG